MNRTHLYRGKRLDNGQFIEGSLIGEDVIVGKIVDFEEDYFTTEFWYKVVPETVGQYTGVPDVNGKNIFEGDHDKDGNCVVFCERCNGWQFAQIDIPTKDICIPCHCCDGNFMFNDIINQFEITGNIHDNKELLS